MAEEEKKEEFAQKRPTLRTFEHDSREFLNTQPMSLIEIAARQQRRGPFQPRKEKKFPWKSIIVVFVIVFFVVLVYFVWRAVLPMFKKTPTPTEMPRPVSQQPLLAVNSSVAVSITPGSDVRSELLSIQKPFVGNIYQVILSQNNAPLSIAQLQTRFGFEMPQNLAAHLTGRYTLFSTAVADIEESLLGLILEADSFDHAFSGMLEWEVRLGSSLYVLGGSIVSEPARFSDFIIVNNDGRVLYGEDKISRAAYVIFDRRFIILSPHVEALRIALERLTAR